MKINRRRFFRNAAIVGIGVTAGSMKSTASPAVSLDNLDQSNATRTLSDISESAPNVAVTKEGTGDNPVPSAEHPINIITLRDLEAEAQKVLPAYSFAYIKGGAGDEWTLRENETALNRWVIEPDFLTGVKAPDLTTTLLGSQIKLPVITAPMGSHALFHKTAETGTARGTAQAGSIYVSSTVSSLDLETIAAASNGPKWFQMYFPTDRGYARELLQRAKVAGYKAIVVTVDVTVVSNRESTLRLSQGQTREDVIRLTGSQTPNPTRLQGNKPNNPGVDSSMKRDLNWDDVAFCATESGLPVLVKSIISVRNVVEAVERGCSGVWISNHGGRQLDNSAASITMLPRIADAVNGRIPIIVDGGFRRGQDVFRALALGASAIALGRPVLYGLSLGGASGVQSVYQHLETELRMVTQLSGVPSIKDITREYVVPHQPV